MVEPLILQRVAALAKATGAIVSIGTYGHRDDWFAHCDGIEYQAPTASKALDAVTNALIERDRQVEREANEARVRRGRIEGLLDG